MKKMGLVVITLEQDLKEGKKELLADFTQKEENCLIKLLLAIRTKGAISNIIVVAL